jgi:hypothetical protein
MKLRIVVLISALMGIASISISGMLATHIMDDYYMYKNESECVAKLIEMGVERRDISTANGTCVHNYKV